MEFNHVPVLKDECIECLNVCKGEIYCDGTLGGGGHSFFILDKLDGTGRLIAIDRDLDAIEAAKKRLAKFDNVTYINDKHENISKILDNLNIDEVSGILLDLGVSSYQLDNEERGFSYMKDSPLDMRMNREDSLTAKTVINKYSESDLSKIFFEYGEEKYSKSIARNIVKAREEKEIDTTFELVDIIKQSMPKKALFEKQHPAKRVFQAIRIEVNGELVELKNTIESAVKKLKIGGRIVIITFHSLEDRIVKKTFEALEGRCTCPSGFPKCVCGAISYGKVLTKKPIEATQKELDENPRSRSAKVRAFERK